jgi:hypothetical protein
VAHLVDLLDVVVRELLELGLRAVKVVLGDLVSCSRRRMFS